MSVRGKSLSRLSPSLGYLPLSAIPLSRLSPSLPSTHAGPPPHASIHRYININTSSIYGSCRGNRLSARENLRINLRKKARAHSLNTPQHTPPITTRFCVELYPGRAFYAASNRDRGGIGISQLRSPIISFSGHTRLGSGSGLGESGILHGNIFTGPDESNPVASGGHFSRSNCLSLVIPSRIVAVGTKPLKHEEIYYSKCPGGVSTPCRVGQQAPLKGDSTEKSLSPQAPVTTKEGLPSGACSEFLTFPHPAGVDSRQMRNFDFTPTRVRNTEK